MNLTARVPQIMLFHIMRNSPPRQPEIEAAVVEPVRHALPPGWKVVYDPAPAGQSGGRFSVIGPDGSRADFAVQARRAIEARSVELALLHSAEGATPLLLYAPYLSPRTRECIQKMGASYADATGNLRLAADNPAFFVQTVGANRDPSPPERRLASLKGPAAARVVRGLCDFRPPYGVRELATRCGAPQSSVARVLQLLDREALIQRTRRGPVAEVDVTGLIRRWVADYSLLQSNHVTHWLAARGLPALVNRLRASNRRYAVTASLAATRLSSVAAPRLAVVYVDRADQAAAEFDLHPADNGANVLLIEPLSEVAFERPLKLDGLNLANPSQVAADLLTSPGRGPAEGEALLKWMQAHEAHWRV